MVLYNVLARETHYQSLKMLLWKVLLAGWELGEGVYVQYWLLCLAIFLCHSAVCSAAARMLFSGGKGTFLAHALYRPAWCHFRGRPEVKDHQGTSGAMGLHGNTVSNQKNSCIAVWKLCTWKNAPNDKVLKTPLRISARWLLGWLSLSLQHTEHGRTPISLRLQQVTDTSRSFIKRCAHGNIQFGHGTYSLCMQQVATYMRHRLSTFPPAPYIKLFALLFRASQRSLALGCFSSPWLRPDQSLLVGSLVFD